MPVFEQIADDTLLREFPGNMDIDRPQPSATVDIIQAVKARAGSAPNAAVPSFEQDFDRYPLAVYTDGHNQCELRRLCVFVIGATPSAFRIEVRKSAVGGDPILARTCFKKIIDRGVGKSLLGAEVGEFISVKARESTSRAEPQKAVGIPDDAVDLIMGQAVDRGV